MHKLLLTAATAVIGLALSLLRPPPRRRSRRSSSAASSSSARKADYKPFGFRDPSGAIVGFEPDIAKYVADKLGVKLEIEPVVSSNRMQFLQQGKIDLMIATMNDKPDRRQIVGIIEPLYYASGVNVLANKKAGLKTWEQLKGQKVCGIQGAWYNKPVAEKYGADFVVLQGPDRGGGRAAAGQLRRLGLRRHGIRRASRRSEVGRLRDDAADASWKSRGASLLQLAGARRRVGQVHGRDARGNAPQRQDDRTREEVEHPGVGVSRRQMNEKYAKKGS